MHMELDILSVHDLGRHCDEQTLRYRQRLTSDTRYCFELLRRALEDHSQDAFTHVFRIYQPMCMNWALHFPGFAATDEPSPDVFVNEGFARLFRDLRGERFQRFESLEAVMAYLKRCIITSILQQLRRPRTVELDESVAEAFNTTIEYDQMWQRVCDLLPETEDRLLADLRFQQGMKPSEIAALHVNRWVTPRDVSVALQRIHRVLRKDTQLRVMLGFVPEANISS